MTKSVTIILVSALAAFAGEMSKQEEVVARMIEQDQVRQSALKTYSVMCRYSLQNKSRKADMLVRWSHTPDGVKQFEIISESGDGGVRSHVFHKLLEAEVEASRPAQRGQLLISPSNYSFEFVGEETVEDRSAYVFDLEPRNDSKYLTRGRIWIDAVDYAVIRVSGAPAHNVSFWTKKVNFVQSYQKQGGLWLMTANHSVTDARLFGLADLTIEYYDYQLPNRDAKAAE
jgi:hypothetical protein